MRIINDYIRVEAEKYRYSRLSFCKSIHYRPKKVRYQIQLCTKSLRSCTIYNDCIKGVYCYE